MTLEDRKVLLKTILDSGAHIDQLNVGGKNTYNKYPKEEPSKVVEITDCDKDNHSKDEARNDDGDEDEMPLPPVKSLIEGATVNTPVKTELKQDGGSSYCDNGASSKGSDSNNDNSDEATEKKEQEQTKPGKPGRPRAADYSLVKRFADLFDTDPKNVERVKKWFADELQPYGKFSPSKDPMEVFDMEFDFGRVNPVTGQPFFSKKDLYRAFNTFYNNYLKRGYTQDTVARYMHDHIAGLNQIEVKTIIGHIRKP